MLAGGWARETEKERGCRGRTKRVADLSTTLIGRKAGAAPAEACCSNRAPCGCMLQLVGTVQGMYLGLGEGDGLQGNKQAGCGQGKGLAALQLLLSRIHHAAHRESAAARSAVGLSIGLLTWGWGWGWGWARVMGMGKDCKAHTKERKQVSTCLPSHATGWL